MMRWLNGDRWPQLIVIVVCAPIIIPVIGAILWCGDVRSRWQWLRRT